MNISVHVLDAVYGRPAESAVVGLEGLCDGEWVGVATHRTDERGWVRHTGARPGRSYRVSVDAARYFAVLGVRCAQPSVLVQLRGPDDAGTCAVSVTLAPHGSTTFVEVS